MKRALLLLLSALALLPATALAQNGDYLTPELRARVEKLKEDLASEPGNRSNLRERARVLWAWANAYALDGGYLPVDVTQAVAAVFAYEDIARARPRLLDDFIRELAMKDAVPDALGTLTADTGPFEARSWITLRQTYTVGSRPVQTGGGFVVARHFMPNYGRWQTTDPSGDNYLSIASSNSSVSFVATTAPMRGMHGAFRGVGEALKLELVAGRLDPGDTVTITYGDRSGGSRGFLMADLESDRMPLPLYLSFGGSDTVLYSLPIQPVLVTGTDIAALRGFAPSVLTPGEPFTLSVRAEDRYRNRARDGHPDIEVLLNGEVLRRVPASRSAISLVEDLSFDAPGVYRLELRSTDNTVAGPVNPILVQDNPTHRIYWGDTHGHSGFAEGIGTPDRFMRWARDDARLDFVTHSEHDIWLDDHEWEVLRDNVARYTREGEFIAYLGYEWSVRNFQGGHHNVLFRTPERRDRLGAQFYPTLSRLYQGLRESAASEDVLVIPHAHQAGDYRLSDPELEPLIEIMSQHGSFEWFGRMYLAQGHQVGFIAASDNHLSQPGYSAPRNGSLAQRGGLGAVLASEKTRNGIFDAMKSLKAYATSGERMLLDVTVNGTGMGQRAQAAPTATLKGRVIGTAPIDSITIVKNDEEIWHREYLSNSDERFAESETLLLSFGSAALPHERYDNPRGWRHWRGTVTVENAELVSAEGRDFHNESLQRLTVGEEAPNVMRFSTLSRGDHSSIALVLKGARRGTRLVLELAGARETGGAPPVYRPPQTMEPTSMTFTLRDLEQGRLEQRLSVPRYDLEDTVSLRRVITDGPQDVSFEFDDPEVRQGDYYFVRVRQADESLAWSSPIWVGSHASR